MLFQQSASIAVAFAASTFLTGVAANHKNLYDSYVDLASNEPSANFCATGDLVQVGNFNKLAHQKRHLEADAAAEVVANILGLVGVDVSAEKGISIGKRDDDELDPTAVAEALASILKEAGIDTSALQEKRHIEADAAAEVVANILGLVGLDVGAEAGVSVGKRSISASIAAQICAQILGLIGVDAKAGAAVHIGKRDVDSDAAARIAASVLAFSKRDGAIDKRNIDISAAAAGVAANILGIFGISAAACANIFVGWGFPSGSCGQSSNNCKTCNGHHSKREAVADAAAAVLNMASPDYSNSPLVKKYLVELYGESEESAVELTKKNIDANVAAQICASILGIFGIDVGAAAGVHIGKRSIDAEDTTETLSTALSLVGRESETEVGKRHISIDVAAQLFAQILGIVGIKAGAGASVHVGKREIEADAAAKVAAEILDLYKKQEESGDDVEKRNIDINAAAGVAANILGIFGISAGACANIFVGWGFPSSSCGGGSSSPPPSGGDCDSCEEGDGGHGHGGGHYGNPNKREAEAAADAIATVLGVATSGSEINADLIKKHLIEAGHDEESADALSKRNIDANVAAQICASILGLFGIQVGAAAGVHIGKREIDVDTAADVLKNVLSVVGREEAPVNPRARRAVTQTEVESKREIDSEALSQALASILSLVETEEPAPTKRDIVDDDVATKIAATIVSLTKADLGDDVEKRNIDINAAAGVAANILGIFGISAAACANIFVGWGFPSSTCGQAADNCHTCHRHKREIDSNVAAAVMANVLDLVGKDISAEVGKDNLKRELKELYGHSDEEAEALSKRGLSAEVAAEVCAQILGLIGIQADAGASVHVGKRSMFDNIGHGILSQFKSSVPQASFAVSDVAWVKEDIFKVTVNFETVESAKLFDNFHEELKTLSIEGTGVYDGEELLWDGSSKSKVDNFARWSSTILVKAKQERGYHCLPEDFAIRFDWNKRPESVLHSVWDQHFETEYQYTLSQEFGTGVERQLIAQEKHQQTSQTDNEFDIASLRYWETSSTELPNFCWPAQCMSN